MKKRTKLNSNFFFRAIRNTLKKEVSFDADAFKNVSREAKDFIKS